MVFFGFSVFAQQEEKSDFKQTYNVVSYSYFSWTEKILLDQGAISDNSRAQFSGSALHFERAAYWLRWGLSPELSLLTGAAAAGGTSTLLTYNPPRTSFWGLHLQIKSDYRMSPRVIFTVGPGLLYRNVKFENANTSLTAVSGSEFNTTVIGELKIRLNPDWDLRQQLGAVLFNAYAYWGIGFGYRF